MFIIKVQRMDQDISLSLSHYQTDRFIIASVFKLFSVERMAPLWQLCERGDLEGVVEALAQVKEPAVEVVVNDVEVV